MGQWQPAGGRVGRGAGGGAVAAKALSENCPYAVTTSGSWALGLSPDEDFKPLSKEELLFPNFPGQSNEGNFTNGMKQNQTASEL